jgi:C-8 sterol isomerase
MTIVFDPEELHRIAKLGVDRPFDEMVEVVVTELDRVYPGHVDTSPRWMFNLTGGATGMMGLLHGSLSEYLILFGSAVGTEGFSGRYFLEIYDFMMTGEMWTCTESRYGERVVTEPGQYAFLSRGEVKSYKITGGSWMLEYGRGPVPTCLPTGLTDAALRGQDPPTIAKTLCAYGRLTVGQLLRGKI